MIRGVRHPQPLPLLFFLPVQCTLEFTVARVHDAVGASFLDQGPC
jgi:hypothetical protein